MLNKIPQPHQLFKFDYYDPAIFTGQVNYLKSDYNDIIPEKDFPTFLFALKQVKNGTDRIKYNRMRMEMTVAKENDDSITTQKMYQYGILFNPDQINFYKLQVEGTNGYMIIEFSPGTDYIDIVVSTKKNSTEKNIKIESEKWENGKLIIVFKKPSNPFIYLNIFFKANAPHEVLMLLNSYVFKYINSPDMIGFKKYETKDSSRKIRIDSKEDKELGVLSQVEVSFSPIKLGITENTSVIYVLKIVEELPNELKGEKFDSIAMKYYKGIVKRANGTSDDTKMSIKITNVDKGYHYAQVIAQIREGSIIEYFGYEPVINPNSKNKQESGQTDKPTSEKEKEKEKENGEDDGTAVYVVVGVSIALLIVVVVLVIIILTFNSKNKNLMKEVQKVSFIDNEKKENQPQVQSINNNEDQNSNLLMDPNEELN